MAEVTPSPTIVVVGLRWTTYPLLSDSWELAFLEALEAAMSDNSSTRVDSVTPGATPDMQILAFDVAAIADPGLHTAVERLLDVHRQEPAARVALIACGQPSDDVTPAVLHALVCPEGGVDRRYSAIFVNHMELEEQVRTWIRMIAIEKRASVGLLVSGPVALQAVEDTANEHLQLEIESWMI